MLVRLIQWVLRQIVKWLPESLLRYMHRIVSQKLSRDALKDSLLTSIRDEIRHDTPDDALRFVFSIDTALYPIESSLSVAYGDGVHSKHRHMRYHDFFTQRIQTNERVLDIGCGIGALAFSIAQGTGASVIGIDYDENNIKFAQERHTADNVQYVLGDVYEYTQTQTFDVVVMSNVLEHLTGRPALLRRIAQQTQAKRFLIRVPRFDRHWSVPLKKELGIEWRLDDDHETEFTPESFAEEMVQAQLTIQHIEYRWDEIWAELSSDSNAT
ncbi:MAG: methyltransferase domain-containing protein [Chloroflexota bacterium]